MIIFDGKGNELSTDGKGVLKGKKVIILADSVFDYEVPDSNNIGQLLAIDANCTVYNWSQGGCCMAKGKATNYDPYSFVGLVDALVDRDFTDQIANASERSFTSQVEEMQTIPVTSCQFMLIAYGTNDYWRSCTYDNPDNNVDTTAFSGAVRYGLQKLLGAYPSLNVLMINMQNLGRTYNETAAWYNKTGSHYVESSIYNGYINDISREFAVPVLDIWGESLINDQTKDTFCYQGSRPHLTRAGKLKYVELIENACDRYF